MMLAALLLTGCQSQEQKREASPVRVETETVGLRTDYAQTPYVGQVVEQSSTAVSFMSAGTVRRVCVEQGQMVSRGQLIAEMDDTSARNALLAAEASLHQAEDAYQRMKQLHDDQTLPEIQWVEMQSKLQQARSAYELSKKNVTDCRLTAPVSGIVGQRLVEAGETAQPRITVPITAVQRGAGQALYVWTVADGTARQTSVTTADTYGGRIVITDGLREGDTVITSGWQKLSEGTRVETKK